MIAHESETGSGEQDKSCGEVTAIFCKQRSRSTAPRRVRIHFRVLVRDGFFGAQARIGADFEFHEFFFAGQVRLAQ